MIQGLYAIIDLPLRVDLPLAAFCRALVAGGARTLQVRGKGLDDRSLAEAARIVLDAAGSVRVVVNDRIEVARALGTWLHLGQEDWAAANPEDLDGLVFGLSTHSRAQVEKALATSARYLGFGPVFETGTKLDAEATVGLSGLRDAATRSDRAVVAIGGITPARAKACVEAGAAAIACISGLLGPTVDAVQKNATAYARAFEASFG